MRGVFIYHCDTQGIGPWPEAAAAAGRAAPARAFPCYLWLITVRVISGQRGQQ